ncbi:MAG TPA: outer membrane lipoprotein-sorting protein [Candidatus Paceibacterota bacterium]|nr:outer membrane lipoprotein-sorting protein [Candidatus Paceibacterota bacterium]
MKRVAFCLLAVLLLTGAAEKVTKPKDLPPEEGAVQGRALVAELLSQKPSRGLTNRGVLTIRKSRKNVTTVPIEFAVVVTGTNWSSSYSAKTEATNSFSDFVVVHPDGESARYFVAGSLPASETNRPLELKPAELMTPFAGSDFWLADLGLEFLNWPGQQLVRTGEIKRGRSCRVLKSTNPQPAPGRYSRVVSWIDNESGGIVHADAYDAQGKWLKQFDPEDFKRVNGEWQLEEMEMLNRQTGSLTRIEFTFDQKPAL